MLTSKWEINFGRILALLQWKWRHVPPWWRRRYTQFFFSFFVLSCLETSNL